MTCIGNLIFSPLITVFLLLSSLMLFTEFACIPNTLIAQALNLLSSVITTILETGSSTWLIGFAQPPAILLWLLLIITLMLIVHIIKKKHRIVGMSCLLLSNSSMLWLYGYFFSPTTIQLKKKSGALTIEVASPGHLVLTDHGLLSNTRSAETFVQYELRPFLLKHFGNHVIDQIILTRPTKSARAIVDELSSLCKVHATLE